MPTGKTTTVSEQGHRSSRNPLLHGWPRRNSARTEQDTLEGNRGFELVFAATHQRRTRNAATLHCEVWMITAPSLTDSGCCIMKGGTNRSMCRSTSNHGSRNKSRTFRCRSCREYRREPGRPALAMHPRDSAEVRNGWHKMTTLPPVFLTTSYLSKIHLPHDFVVRGAFTQKGQVGHRLAVAGVGWHRRIFDIPERRGGGLARGLTFFLGFV